MDRFNGKIAFVTGSGTGMAAATEKRLASEGAAVAIVDWHKTNANAAVVELKEAGGRAVAQRYVGEAIRIDKMCPGVIDPPLFRSGGGSAEQITAMIPGGRIGRRCGSRSLLFAV